MFKLLDLFSGIGGFSLGLERSGFFKTVAFCEIEPFPRAVLRKHWPEIPIYEDVRTLTAERLAADGITIDAICGGFPCQDVSSAGKKKGLGGSKSSLWQEYRRIISELRPGVVVVENSSDLRARGFGNILGDLAALGYDAEWHCIPAAAVGAPHRRDRIWIIAHPNSKGEPAKPVDDETSGLSSFGNGPYAYGVAPIGASISWPKLHPWADESRIPRVAHGIPDQVHRRSALGNSVVPLIPEIIGHAIGLSTDVRHTQQLAAELSRSSHSDDAAATQPIYNLNGAPPIASSAADADPIRAPHCGVGEVADFVGPSHV